MGDGGGHGTSSEITCDRPKHRSAAFMLEPVSNLWERKGVRGRERHRDRQSEGRCEKATKTEIVNN